LHRADGPGDRERWRKAGLKDGLAKGRSDTAQANQNESSVMYKTTKASRAREMKIHGDVLGIEPKGVFSMPRKNQQHSRRCGESTKPL
jgi:hypothetical protein